MARLALEAARLATGLHGLLFAEVRPHERRYIAAIASLIIFEQHWRDHMRVELAFLGQVIEQVLHQICQRNAVRRVRPLVQPIGKMQEPFEGRRQHVAARNITIRNITALFSIPYQRR